MENSHKSWATGCGTGCLSFLFFLIFTWGFCVATAFILWEFGDVRDEFLRPEPAIMWGGVIGFLTASVLGGALVFVSQFV